MVETRFDELKRYVRFDEDDARALAALGPIAAPHFARIAREFFERVREHEDAHAVFTGEAQVERLERALVRWMGRLLSGTYDERYVEETDKIARVHVRVGLPQRYMFSAMTVVRLALEEIADRELGAGAPQTRRALTRLLDIVLAIMVETYRDDMAEQARRRDAAEAHRLESDLAHALRRYTNAVDATPSLIVGIDGEGAIRLLNRTARLVTGYALEDVFGMSFVDTLVMEDMRPKDGPLVASLLVGPPTHHDEDSFVVTRAGKVRDVRWRFTRVDTADAAPEDIVLFAVGADLTEPRIQSRQAEQNERLAALGTLAAGLAHEIRNPLNGAQLHVAFLRRSLEKRCPEPELLETVAIIADEIRRLARLVSEFLDFARPLPLTRTRVAIGALVARVAERCAGDAARAGIRLEVDVPTQPLVVSADEPKLEQALVNMVENALDALEPAGKGRVVLRARRRPRDVRIEVEDDGPGLPSPETPVFDAFFSTKPTGTGLGLTITHRVVTDHGGTVDVESRPGRTCFGFTIPVRVETASLDGEGQ